MVPVISGCAPFCVSFYFRTVIGSAVIRTVPASPITAPKSSPRDARLRLTLPGAPLGVRTTYIATYYHRFLFFIAVHPAQACKHDGGVYDYKKNNSVISRSCNIRGAGDRGRTDTVSLPRDFESRASANSTTPASVYILPLSFGKIKCFYQKSYESGSYEDVPFFVLFRWQGVLIDSFFRLLTIRIPKWSFGWPL